MDTGDIATLALGLAILGFLWSIHRDITGLHRDMAGLRERMARLEGMFEGFTGRRDQESTPYADMSNERTRAQ